MKFSEIQRYTSVGHYQINVSLKYLVNTMDRYTKEYELDMCPDFQRGHVWSFDQQVKYVEFLLRGGNNNQPIFFNCPRWHEGFRENFVLVDGLQRITACLKFLNNELPVFNTLYKDFEDKLFSMEPSLIFNINDLKSRKEVLKWYLELNSGGTPHSPQELERVAELLNKEEKNEI